MPLVVHGNGRSKLVLNSLGNYLARAWDSKKGCLACWDNTIELDLNSPETLPRILLAIYIPKETPFLEEFFQKIYQQSYPKSKLNLFIYNNVNYHELLVNQFIEKFGKKYENVKKVSPSDEFSEEKARNLGL